MKIVKRVLWLVCLVTLLSAQTNPLKNLQVSPIASVQRWTCTGSGTNPDGTKWDCNGLSMIKMVLVDGTVVGPFVGVTADAATVANRNWVPVPLTAPTPTTP